MIYLKSLENYGHKTGLSRLLLFALLTLGLLISSYLFYIHFILVNHLGGQVDICSTVFGSGCDGAMMSSVGTQMGLPLAAWGIIYYTLMILLLLLPAFLGNSYKANTLLPVFTLSLIASLGSIGFLAIMFFDHNLFCPFCLIIHCINLLLFLSFLKKTGYTFPIFFSNLRHEIISLFRLRTFKKALIIKWFALATFILLTICMYTGLQMISVNPPAIDVKEIITGFNQMPIQKIAIEKDDPIFGSTAAPVKIAVFSDFQCPSCRYFSQVIRQLNILYHGRFYVVFKYFPLCTDCNLLVTKNIHPKACEAAFAAVAANEQGKFWQFHDLLFSVDLNENKETFLSMAKSLNLDTMKFEKAFSSETARDKVVQSVQQGIRLNITGTPTVYMNDKKVNDFRLKPMEILMNFLLEEPILKNVN
jgi:protein-disulfide isomerase/uncharacterized membrane protein